MIHSEHAKAVWAAVAGIGSWSAAIVVAAVDLLADPAERVAGGAAVLMLLAVAGFGFRSLTALTRRLDQAIAAEAARADLAAERATVAELRARELTVQLQAALEENARLRAIIASAGLDPDPRR